MLKKQPRREKKNSPLKPHVGLSLFPFISSADDCLFPPSPPYSPHFLRRIGLVVFWLRKGNHRTAGAWIFQMTNVAHAYFWHIWLPQGNKTLLMQGDHLLSVAGVSEQAGLVCTNTHTLMRWKTHTGMQARRQTDRHILTQREAYIDSETHAHTHVLTAEPVGSTHNRQALNSYTNWTLLFLIQCVCQTCCKSRAVGWQGARTLFMLAINTWACLLAAAGAG